MESNRSLFWAAVKRWAGPVLFILSLTVYLITMCRGAFPGESARLITQHTGLDPFPPLAHPVWSLLARAVALIPLGALPWRLNLLSVGCGAAAVWLFYSIVARFTHNRGPETNYSGVTHLALQQISGIFAALAFAFCIPFWIVATRAYTLALDVLLLLSAIWLLIRYRETKRPSWLYGWALLCGVGVTEFATFFLFAPILGVWALFLMWQNGALKLGRLAALAGLGALGLLFYLVPVLENWFSPAYEWRGFKGFWSILFFVLREQYVLIGRSLPKIGWLVILLVSVVPWLLVVVLPTHGDLRGGTIGAKLLRLLLAGLALLLLFNHFIAPWSMLGLGFLLVTPYLLIAAWAGHIAAYWYGVLAAPSRFGMTPLTALRMRLAPYYLAGLAILLAVIAGFNLRVTAGRNNRVVERFVQQVVANLGGRDWLITNGYLDDNIMIAAAGRGIPLRIINTSLGRATAYLKYVGSLFDDPRLQGLAQVGLGPLISEWLATWPDASARVAIMSESDVWLAAGFQPLPDEVFIRGVKDPAAVAPAEIYERHRRFWADYGAFAIRDTTRNRLTGVWNRWILRHLSKLANNLGVFLEDRGEIENAFASYQEARRLDPANISALLNLLNLAASSARPELEALQTEFEKLVNSPARRPDVWSLAFNYGFVRNPEIFLRRGQAWAMSGKPQLAIRDLQRARDLGADTDRIGVALGSLYFMQDMSAESGAAYAEVLERNPDNPEALLGMLRVCLRQNDLAGARGYLERIKALQPPDALVRFEEARLDLLAGDREKARESLIKITAENAKLIDAWALLAFIAQAENNPRLLARCLEMLEPAAARTPSLRLTLAELALARNDLAVARKQLEDFRRVQPNSIRALELLVGIDIRQNQRDDAERHVDALLNLDPRNALANQVLGSIQMYREQYALAEASLRASLATRRSSDALNDLAWVLHLKGADAEALPLAEEAVQLNPANILAFDTLGVIQMSLGQIDAAETSLQKAIAAYPGHPQIQLHVAQLYEKKGLAAESLRMADQLLVQPGRLPTDDYKELRALVKRLRPGA